MVLSVLVSDFADAYAVDGEHQLAFDDVLGSAEALGVLHHGLSIHLVDEVGDVPAGTLYEDADGLAFGVLAALSVLCWYQFVWHLFAQVGDYACALPQLQLGGTAVLLGGGVGACALRAVLVAP